jgi:hypothetical protein
VFGPLDTRSRSRLWIPRHTSDGRPFASISESSKLFPNRHQVTAKARHSSNNNAPRIDAASRWRYSQGQIPDLVANAIPRFSQPAKCFGAATPHAFPSPQNPTNICLSLDIPDRRIRLYTTVWTSRELRGQPRQSLTGVRLGSAVIHSIPPSNATREALDSFEDRSGDHAKL